MNSGNEQLHKIFKKGDELVSRQIAGETILVPIRGELVDMQQIFALNPVAEYIWQELDGQKDLSEICEGVLANFEVDREQAETDLQEFVGELLAAGLILES
jgi:hypothetical protein